MLSRFLVMLLASLVHGRACDQCGGDWWSSFDSAGWSTCKDGCGMAGLYLNSVGGCKSLYCLEEAKCCRIADEHTCNEVDILLSFDTRGWAGCPSNQYMCHIRRCIINNRTLEPQATTDIKCRSADRHTAHKMSGCSSKPQCVPPQGVWMEFSITSLGPASGGTRDKAIRIPSR